MAATNTRVLPRCVAALAMTGLTVLLGVLTHVDPVWAHTALRETTPASDSVVSTPVENVTLTFTQSVKQQFTTVIVSAAGSAFSDGPARTTGGRVVQRVRPLPAGLVTVAWRAVAGDGFPVQGSFTFTMAYQGIPGPSPAPSSADGSPDGTGTASPGTASPGGASGAGRRGAVPVAVMATTAVVAAIGVVAVLVIRRRSNHAGRTVGE